MLMPSDFSFLFKFMFSGDFYNSLSTHLFGENRYHCYRFGRNTAQFLMPLNFLIYIFWTNFFFRRTSNYRLFSVVIKVELVFIDYVNKDYILFVHIVLIKPY